MAVSIRQEINLADWPFTISSNATYAPGISGSALSANAPPLAQLDTTQYVNPTYYFETVASNGTTGGTLTIKLQRAGGTTTDATITVTASASVSRQRVSFTPPAGQTEYGLQAVLASSSAGTASFKAARIIVIDNPTTLTSTETQIEIGGDGSAAYTNTTAAALTSPKYWKYTSANWNGTKTFFAEVVYKTASTNTATIVLQEDNGSFTFSDKTTIVNAVSNTTRTRTRVSFTPTDGRNYRITVKSSTTKSNVQIFNAKVIVDQNLALDSFTQTDETAFSINGGTAGSGETGQKVGQSFTTTSGYSVTHIRLLGHSIGTFSDTYKLEIRSTSISGTLLGTSDELSQSDLYGSSAINGGKWSAFTFSTPVALSNATKYYLALYRTGARDTSNRYQWRGFGSSGYANGGKYQMDSTVWSSESATVDLCFQVDAGSNPTLLEPQYLLLNTADDNTTNNQGYQTLWDSTEWSGVGNPTQFKHAMDSDNASNSADLVDIDNSSTTLTGSSATGANQQITAGITMPTTGHQVDTDMDNTTGVVAASRILVFVGPNIDKSDTATVTESVTVSITGGSPATLTINLSDTVTITESPTLLIPELFKSVSDTATITETTTEEINSFISVSDTSNITESATLTMVDNISVSDTANITETITLQELSFINVSDTATMTETTSQVITPLFISVTDSVSITETVTKVEESFISASDTANITESTTLLETSFINKTDSVSITETATLLEESYINKTDSITVTETTTQLIPFLLISSTDSVTITESASFLELSFVSVSDSPTITESITLLETSFISVTDSPAITESITLLETSFISKTDSITITETSTVAIAVVGDYTVSVSDTATITETITFLETSFINNSDSTSITESTVVSEVSFISVSDSLTITESITLQEISFISLSDTVTIAETTTRLLESSISVTDSLTITETVNVYELFYLISVTDSTTVSESSTVFIQVQNTLIVTDNITITESVTLLIPTLLISVTDSSTITESTSVSVVTPTSGNSINLLLMGVG